MTSGAWWSSWSRIGHVGFSALFFYLLIVVQTRISGKRTIGQMNNFDWIILVTVGSLAASGILLTNVPVAEAAAAIVFLFLLQGFTTWSVLRSRVVSRLIKAEPTLLVHRGAMLQSAMRQALSIDHATAMQDVARR